MLGIALSTLLIVAAVHFTGTAGTAIAANGENPPSLMNKARTIVGQNGMGPMEGPGSAAQDAFDARVYPNTELSVQQDEAVKAAYTAVEKDTFGKVEGSTAFSVDAAATTDATKSRAGDFTFFEKNWRPIGPSRALYPFEELRTSSSYVPNEYVAGGRTTSIAISDRCTKLSCRMWITPAGGGVWRTDRALSVKPQWKYLGGPLGINAAGSITIDGNDKSGNTLYLGTGEANASADSTAGVGVYRTTNGGETWVGPLGKAELGGKGIGEIVIKPGDPNTIFAATTRAIRGNSSTGGAATVAGAAKAGLYRSTDRGQTWQFLHNGSADPAKCTGSPDEIANRTECSPRGVRQVKLDPSNPATVYAGSYSRGLWRSTDSGTTWEQIKASLDATGTVTRPAFAVAALPNGKTRLYLYEGNAGAVYSRMFRSDDVATGTPVFTDMTSANPADAGFAWYNLCGSQCWYDVFVHSPKGQPDTVYVGGSYAYGENVANKRAVVLSTDAGATGTDMTFDGTDATHPNGLHPDQHALVTNPNNPLQFFEANDGGVMRSSGTLVDRSVWCDDPARALTPEQLARCRQMLSKIPERLDGINDGLATLQFQSLSVSPFDSSRLQGGTQDNGTWETGGNRVEWRNTMIGDGGASGFDVARQEFRQHSFYDATPEVNFNNGELGKWIDTSDPLYGHPGTLFYPPISTDPKVSGTMFVGTGTGLFRTQTFGLGTRTQEEAQRDCNSWTRSYEIQCGDWVQVGTKPLPGAEWGDRAGGAVSVITRSAADTTTLWAATNRGRVFITRNADAAAAAVTFSRVDSATSPSRFVSSIHVDPANPNRAWISYNGFGSNTPTTPGHAYEVVVDPATGVATWTDISHNLGDLPITDLVRDDVTGTLYAGSDFGVLKLTTGSTSWKVAGRGLPNVSVTGLTVVPGERLLYAATHGLSAWKLKLGH